MQIIQMLTLYRTAWRLHRFGKMGEDSSIDWIGLRQPANSSPEISYLMWIDDDHRQPNLLQSKSQFIFVAACCFQHNALRRELFQLARPRLCTGLVVVD